MGNFTIRAATSNSCPVLVKQIIDEKYYWTIDKESDRKFFLCDLIAWGYNNEIITFNTRLKGTLFKWLLSFAFRFLCFAWYFYVITSSPEARSNRVSISLLLTSARFFEHKMRGPIRYPRLMRLKPVRTAFPSFSIDCCTGPIAWIMSDKFYLISIQSLHWKRVVSKFKKTPSFLW